MLNLVIGNMILVVLILFLSVLVLFWKYGRKHVPRPPGPKPYPFIGCLPQFISANVSIPEMVRHHRKTYGDISSFPLMRMNLGDKL